MSLLDTLHYYIEETRDPRTLSWPFLSITTLVVVYFCYFYFIYGCGPRYMKDRPAYSLKTVLWCYNIFEIVAHITLVRRFIQSGLITDISKICESLEYSMDPQKLQIASTIWWSYVLRVIDLVETVFFVLRKKDRQISTLHVHHHVMAIFLCWLGLRYAPAGIASFFLFINSCVHVIMYTYYFLSSLNPTVQAMIGPYKPLLTIVQMVQLTVILGYLVISLMPDCLFPKMLSCVAIPNIFLNLYFFYDFYKKTYKAPKSKK